MTTFNEAVRDAMVRHQLGLLQFGGHLRNRIWRILDASESDLRKQIKRYAGRAGFDTPARVKRLEALLAALRETRIKAWTQATDVWLEELNGLALAEPAFLDSVIQGAVPVELGATLPAAARLRAIVKSHPFEGKTMREWADKVRRDDIDRIESAVKVGLVQNENLPQISRRIVGTVSMKGRNGVTQITRRNAEAITRTAVSSVSSEAREAYFEENDFVEQKLFTATLDSRTTPICRAYDGQLFDLDDPKAPVLPLHFGERSLYSPVIDGEIIGDRPRKDFSEQQLVREYAKENGLDVAVPSSLSAKQARGRLPKGHKGSFDKFARRRMRELTGTTPAKTTYGQWLKRQSAAVQDDIMGGTKGALFRRGDLTLDKFVEPTGRELSLSELAQRYPGAFTRANLSPSDYR